MENITLVKVNPEDWKDVLSIESKCSSKCYHAITEESEVKDYVKDSIIYFIVLNDKKVGTVSYEIKDNSAHIDGLTVLPEYRGQGIASFAIKKLLERLKDLNSINLDVHPENNPAIIIYLKNGFSIKKWNANRFGEGEHRLFLEKNLK